MTPHFHQGAAEIFRLLDSTSFASESPETIDRNRTLKDTIEETARRLREKSWGCRLDGKGRVAYQARGAGDAGG